MDIATKRVGEQGARGFLLIFIITSQRAHSTYEGALNQLRVGFPDTLSNRMLYASSRTRVRMVHLKGFACRRLAPKHFLRGTAVA